LNASYAAHSVTFVRKLLVGKTKSAGDDRTFNAGDLSQIGGCGLEEKKFGQGSVERV
jgi:hypothetical protein